MCVSISGIPEQQHGDIKQIFWVFYERLSLIYIYLATEDPVKSALYSPIPHFDSGY